MGKDREGKFHPRRGKPSGNAKEGIGLQPIDTTAIEEHQEIAEKYTEGEEQPATNLHRRHPNRNVDKREERQRNKEARPFDDASSTPVNEGTVVRHNAPDVKELPAMLTKEQFAELANFKSECCITVYMDMTASSSVEANRQKNFIGFKNRLQQLAASLKERNVDQTGIDNLLKPGYGLLRNEDFWSNQSQGLALFISEGHFIYVRLPLSPKDEILINSSFYLAPLIPVMTSREYFYVLVLSKKQAKIYRADAFAMHFIPVAGMPRGVDDVVHFEEKGDRDLYRTDTAGAGAGANYHGIGTGRPDPKTDLAMYFDEVDETLWKELLNKENVPLVLAGVEYLIPIYRQVAQYKPIWDVAVTGSHEHEDIAGLYQRVRSIMEPYFQERITKALNNYANQSATELTSSITDDIIPAAHYGRVFQLFASKGDHIWGSFDEMNNALTVHATREKDDECLVDKAVIKTLLNGGDVFILPAEKMPARSKLAAVMRY